jgi:hypothetical protein
MQKKILEALFFIFAFTLLFSKNTFAADLVNVRDTITTSRPSASSPLSANASSGDSDAVIFNNGSFFLASDSAKIINGSTGAVVDAATIVASQSSSMTTVYFGETIGSNASAGVDVLTVPITALHTLQFTTVTEIPAGGDIRITFPGSANNTASPSATTFAFNGLDATGGVGSNIVTNNITCNASSAVTAPQIMCETTSLVAAGTTITFLIGCSAQSGGACTTQVPRLINPTKTASAGIADIWKVSILTRDGGDVTLDSSTISIGTIDSVTVRASIDPTLSFTITGITNGLAANTGNTTGCLQTETANAGVDSTSTEVNLGLLANSPSGTDVKVGNIAAQRINISTNGSNGYTLTATSSGQLINPTTGFFLASATTPTAFPASGADWFGIHACGLDTYNSDIGTTFWNTDASNTECGSCISGSSSCPLSTPGTNVCKYGWPNTTTPLSIASDTTGPIGNSLVAGNGVISIAYAAGTDAGVPPGEYRTVITYVATPAF